MIGIFKYFIELELFWFLDGIFSYSSINEIIFSLVLNDSSHSSNLLAVSIWLRLVWINICRIFGSEIWILFVKFGLFSFFFIAYKWFRTLSHKALNSWFLWFSPQKVKQSFKIWAYKLNNFALVFVKSSKVLYASHINFCSARNCSSSIALGESEKYSSWNSLSFSSFIKLLLEILKFLDFSEESLYFSNKSSLHFLTIPSKCSI